MNKDIKVKIQLIIWLFSNLVGEEGSRIQVNFTVLKGRGSASRSTSRWGAGQSIFLNLREHPQIRLAKSPYPDFSRARAVQ
jgi:hypothetical protein